MSMELDGFARLGAALIAERGPLRLYALLEREDDLDRWDLVLSAEWVKGVTLEDMGYVMRRMKKFLSQQERDMVAHIILLRQDEPAVKSILDISRPITGISGAVGRDIHRRYVNGMLINQGYILAAGDYSQPAARSISQST